jgi:hypothetical protein
VTIIAFDGESLVADGRATGDEGSVLIADTYKKLHVVNIPKIGRCVVGLCGALDVQGPLLEHIANAGLTPLELFNPADVSKGYFMRGIAVTKKGEYYEFASDGGWHKGQGKTALGSGSTIAQHYLTKGCDAFTAVVETCKTELSCGGQITVFKVSDGSWSYFDASGKPVEAP